LLLLLLLDPLLRLQAETRVGSQHLLLLLLVQPQASDPALPWPPAHPRLPAPLHLPHHCLRHQLHRLLQPLQQCPA
jgi:hypothetical protein